MSIIGVGIAKNYPEFLTFLEKTKTEIKNSIKEGMSGKGFLVDNDDLDSLEDSKITGEEYTFDTTFYPYYGMLTNQEQKLYKQIYANADKKKTTFIPIVTVDTETIKTIMDALYNDHPELFWIDNSYSYKYKDDSTVVQIILNFNSTIEDFENSKKKFDKAANKIINKAKKKKSNYEKEKYVHDEILKLATYQKDADLNQSAYSALVLGKTVCAGYSRAFQYIMIELGIPTYYVSGYSSQEHAWNMVKLSDGYYIVDLTWDSSNPFPYQYFNVSDSDIAITHKRRGLSQNLPSCNGKKYRNLEVKKEEKEEPEAPIEVIEEIVEIEEVPEKIPHHPIEKEEEIEDIDIPEEQIEESEISNIKDLEFIEEKNIEE